MGEGRFSRIYEAFNELSEDFLWSDWLEWWEQNAIALCIVFVLVSGLGSCAFFYGKEALASTEPEQRIERNESSQNPWSVDKRETVHQPR